MMNKTPIAFYVFCCVWLFSFLGMLPNACAQSNKRSEKSIAKAEKLIGSGKKEKALNLLSEVIKEEPQNSKAFFLKGRTEFEQDNFQLSICDLKKAIDIDASNQEAHYWLGRNYQSINKCDSALLYFDKASLSDETYHHKALCYVALKSWEKALENIEKINVLGENKHIILSEKGMIKYQLKQYKEALIDLNSSLSIDTLCQALFYKGSCLYELKDPANAILTLNKAIVRDDKLAGAYLQRAMARDALNDYSGAVLDYSRAINLQPDYYTYYSRGRSSFNQADFNTALQDFERAKEIEPKDPDICYYLGAAYFNLKEYDKALKELSEAILLRKDHFESWFLRGLIKAQMNNMKGLIEDLDKAIEINPNNGEAYFNRGLAKYNLLLKQGACLDWQQAKKLGFEEATKYMRYCQ